MAGAKICSDKITMNLNYSKTILKYDGKVCQQKCFVLKGFEEFAICLISWHNRGFNFEL